jgi:Ricin-type beta-trefoil lectin domain
MNPDGTIVNKQSGRCLDADLGTIGANGTKMQLWDCWGGNNQKWNAMPAKNPDQTVSADGTMRNIQIGRCLDADLGTIGTNGTKVQLWDCWNGPNQTWYSPMEFGYAIVVLQSGRCLDADLGTIVNNGTIVQLWDCLSGENQNQAWTVLPTGRLVNLRSHRCLDADLGTIGANGTKVQLWDCWNTPNNTPTPNQVWSWPGFDPGGGVPGSAITNAQSQRCLDADLGTIGANGTKVQLWDCWGGDNQFWKNPLIIR